MQENLQNHLAAVMASNILDLHILPTEQCNFRCVYCYETFHLGKMKPEIVDAVKRFLRLRIYNLQQLRISWFGGEPLAAFDVVLELSQYARELAIEAGCRYQFGMTTNGYLLDRQRFLNLLMAGVCAYQISIDGPPEVHDQTRKRADGKGTFERIWGHLLDVQRLALDFEIILRVHVTPENFSLLPDLLGLMKIQFKYDRRFKVFLKPIANLGGPNSGKFDVLKGKTRSQILRQLHKYLGNDVGVHSIAREGLPYICYAAAQNAWVIRADGSLAKCTVLMEDERNRIGRLNQDGTLTLDQQKLKLWLRGFKTMDTSTMMCPAAKLPRLRSIPVKVV